jgi:MFS transporter, SET family, sugar efflux transporter
MLFSLCALVEIPAALALVPPGVRLEPLLLAGMALFVVCFAVAALSQGLPALAVAQVARGAAIAVVGALGITYFQDLVPGRAGRATAIFANTATTGSMVSGVLAGATAQLAGYRATFALWGVLAAAGTGLILIRRRGPAVGHPPVAPPRVPLR